MATTMRVHDHNTPLFPPPHRDTVTSSLPVGCAGKLRARTTKFTILWESGGWWCDAIRKIDGDGDGDGGQTWTDSSWHCRSAKPKPNEDASAQLIETKKKAIYIHTYIHTSAQTYVCNNNKDMRQLTWQHKVAAATKKKTAAPGNGKLQWKGNCRASLMNVMATRSRHD